MKTLTEKESDYEYLLSLGIDLERFWLEIEKLRKEKEACKNYDEACD